MDFIVYMTTAIFVFALAYIIFQMTPQSKPRDIYERFMSSTLQEKDVAGDIHPTSAPPPKAEGCEPKESPWFDHRVIGFCEDSRLTTPGRLVLPNISTPGEIFATCINE